MALILHAMVYQWDITYMYCPCKSINWISCYNVLQQVHQLASLLPTMFSRMAALLDPPNYIDVLLGVTFSIVAYTLWHAVHCRPELQKMDFRYSICGR